MTNLHEDIEYFGELKEGIFIAGFTFERGCRRLEMLLEDDRWRLGGRFEDINAFLDAIKLDKLRASTDQRQRIAKRIKELQPDASNRQIAKTLGVDEKTVRNDTADKSAADQKKINRNNGQDGQGADNSASGPSGSMAAAQLDGLKPIFTGETEWYTPPPIIALVREVYGGKIDLDPASCAKAQEIVQATKWFDKESDGLHQKWRGNVFLNPPYKHPDIECFVDKLLAELKPGCAHQAILLVHNYTETDWFQKAAKSCAAICFPDGRIRFIDPDGGTCNPRQGQALLYFGSLPVQFKVVFETIGFVVMR